MRRPEERLTLAVVVADAVHHAVGREPRDLADLACLVDVVGIHDHGLLVADAHELGHIVDMAIQNLIGAIEDLFEGLNILAQPYVVFAVARLLAELANAAVDVVLAQPAPALGEAPLRLGVVRRRCPDQLLEGHEGRWGHGAALAAYREPLEQGVELGPCLIVLLRLPRNEGLIPYMVP